MRKPKSLLVAFALLGCSIGAWAQTDVSDKISNSSITGQSANNVVPTGWTAGARKVGNDHYTEGTGDTQLLQNVTTQIVRVAICMPVLEDR